MLFRIAKLLHFSQKTLVRYRFFDCIVRKRTTKFSLYHNIYGGRSTNSCFLLFQTIDFVIVFHGEKRQFDETPFGENKTPKELFQTPFHSCPNGVSLYVHELAEKSTQFFSIAWRKKSLNAVKFPNKILSLQLQKHVYL